VAPILLAVFINWWAGAMGNRQLQQGMGTESAAMW